MTLLGYIVENTTLIRFGELMPEGHRFIMSSHRRANRLFL
jgi:hypothetical protein